MSHFRLLLGAALVLSVAACTSPDLTGGGAVIPPEQGDPTVEVVVLAADDLGVLDAIVTVDGIRADAGSDGTIVLPWQDRAIELEASAPGFQPFEYTIEALPDGGKVEFRLEPVLLTGRVTTDDGRPLPGATVELNGRVDLSDTEGRYSIERAVPGTMVVTRPAWDDTEYEWDGAVTALDLSMAPTLVYGIRASAEDAADSTRWQSMVALAQDTGINAMVVDLKTDDGTVTYASSVPLAVSSGAVNPVIDLDSVLGDLDAAGLRPIARIVAFQDDFATAAIPEQAVTAGGALWRTPGGRAWLDPSDPASHEYPVAIAEEACEAGFAEIQFDMVSWPIGDLTDATFDGEYTQEVRVDSIIAFLDRAYAVLHPRCAVSVTVLGIVLESGSDEGVGQSPSAMSRSVDILSPTLYTTNYGSGWKNWDDPDEHAVELVTTALAGGAPRLDGFAYLRPWLQTWGISESDQLAVQSAVADDGMGYLLWSNNANYSRSNLPPR